MKKVEALFEHARHDAFTPDQAERLWSRVVSAAGTGAGSAEPPAASNFIYEPERRLRYATYAAIAPATRRTLSKVKSSAMMPRQPSVPNLMGVVIFGRWSLVVGRWFAVVNCS